MIGQVVVELDSGEVRGFSCPYLPNYHPRTKYKTFDHFRSSRSTHLRLGRRSDPSTTLKLENYAQIQPKPRPGISVVNRYKDILENNKQKMVAEGMADVPNNLTQQSYL